MTKRILFYFLILFVFLISGLFLFQNSLIELKQSNQELSAFLKQASDGFTKQTENFEDLESLGYLVEQPVKLSYITDVSEFKKEYINLLEKLKNIRSKKFEKEIDALVSLMIQLYDLKSSEITSSNASLEIESKRLPVILDNINLISQANTLDKVTIQNQLKLIGNSLSSQIEDALSLHKLSIKSRSLSFQMVQNKLLPLVKNIQNKIIEEKNNNSGDFKGSFSAIQESLKKTELIQINLNRNTKLFSVYLAIIFLIASSLIFVSFKNFQLANDLKIKQKNEILGIFESIANNKTDHAIDKLDRVSFQEPVLESAKELIKKVLEINTARQLALKNEAQAIIAKQVAHDIRSPLSALNIIAGSLTNISEEKRLLIRNSVQRINDIANDLLQKGKSTTLLQSEGEPQTTAGNVNKSNLPNINNTNAEPENKLLKKNQSFLVPIVVDNIISEKRIQFREKMNVHINVDLKKSFGLFVNANPNDLSRVISNLINNAVEALPNQSGNIDVSVFTDATDNVCIQIKDNGSGIPKHVLEKLGQAGITHGKENTQSGSGLGVYHAIKTIQEFGGQIKFHSVTADDLPNTTYNNSTGTTITIELPKSNTPSWFADSIQLNSRQEFVTVDDDISIHQIWKGRLESLKSKDQNIKITSFTSAKEFREYFNRNLKSALPASKTASLNTNSDSKPALDHNVNSPYLFLIDYEFLNQDDNGLKIITDLEIQNNAILVTSRFDEPFILSDCELQSIKILPKQLAGQIPITIQSEKVEQGTGTQIDYAFKNLEQSGLLEI